MTNAQHNLERHYQLFSRDHDRLKAELMARLPETGYMPARRRVAFVVPLHLNTVLRRGLAAAVLVAFLMTVVFMNLPGQQSGPANAWASAVEHVQKVESVHFVYTTLGGGKASSSVEMWWQRPGKFRMVFSNGDVHAGDLTHRYIKPSNGPLRVIKDGNPGPEIALLNVLGELGEAFTREISLTPDLVSDSQPVSSEPILFKGQPCFKVCSLKGGFLFEYIIDRKQPVIYQVTQYRSTNPENPIALAEVLDIDGQLDNRLFEIEPEAAHNTNER